MARDVEPGARGSVERRKSGGLRPLHTLAVVAAGVVGVLIAFWVLSSIAGIIWGIVKIAVIVAVVGGLVWLFMGRRHRR